MNINKKQSDLFQELSSCPNQCRSYDELAEILKVSTRSIRNYCVSLEEYITGIGLSPLIEHTTTGLTYIGTSVQTKQIWERINKSGFYEFHLSPDDRLLAIVLILLDLHRPITVMELCDILFVSRATILNDIEKVKLYFQQYNVRFEANTARGYNLKITETQRQEIICATCFPYLGNWNPLDTEGNLFFHTEMIAHLNHILPKICHIVQKAEHQYDIPIADISYKQTVFVLAVLCKSLMEGYTIDPSLRLDKQLKNTAVGKIAYTMLEDLHTVFDISYTENDLLYLAWHLHLCHFDILQNFEHSVDLYFYMEVHQFLHSIEDDLHCTFSNNQKLSIMLTRHIWSLRNGTLQKGEIAADEVIENYQDYFAIVKKHIPIIERCIGRACTESELISILLYIVAEIERQNRKIQKPKVIVLCHVGIGTANYLADRLLETFNLEVVEVTTIHKLPTILKEKKFDLLISTVPLKLEHVNWINVSPILEDIDIVSIQKALAAVHKQNRCSKAGQTSRRSSMDFTKFLKKDHIVLDIPCTDWRDALSKAAIPLLEKGEIQPQYVDAIQHSVDVNGPYFVFCPGVALAHAAPTDGVLEFCCSIYRPQEPVSFYHTQNDPVSLIIMIGITDVNTQVRYVSALMEVFRKKEFMERILHAQTPEKLITILLENI
ncbi:MULTISPECIES: BglG family transcription antiterminator [Lachnospiraceae]|jgi:mannitol operon transcriptional antiterminator|uniref:PTS sugar transporter subunit IIA n=1 Tax=Faecalicatena acetigenes TaxID=2981790 RepID=A0ABT2T796_9FIRM|nr:MULTISPECIES: PTS sugar transporter subunit IIA [Lachnospiraceae]MCU6746105.1 PTS sugar transporter subunit IIA [Faecalicatena acetigenes]RGT74957.1 HTH domain-containing protein [Ruminococcus sp. AF18-22]SCG95448.1 Ascorbate-specific phosphotransferase enzyme IIA component [uncultured Clostridium sp.]